MNIRDKQIREYIDLLIEIDKKHPSDDLHDRIERSIKELESGVGEVRMVAYDFPLRPDVLVRLTLPMDLTVAEAARIGEMVNALAFPEDD